MTIQEASTFVKDLAQNKFKLELINNNWHGYTKAIFREISNDNSPVCRLQRKRDKLKLDYEDIARPYVRGEMYGSEGGGTPLNSWHQSVEENLHIERQKILEEISAITIEQRIIEEQLKKETDAFETLVYSLKNASMSEALMLFYLNKKHTDEIANILNYELSTIEQYIFTGVKEISKILKNNWITKEN